VSYLRRLSLRSRSAVVEVGVGSAFARRRAPFHGALTQQGEIMTEIKHFMTASSHAIGHDQTLKLAHERMQQFGIHHLPVLDGGVLVGVVSERDIALVSAISPPHAEDTPVEEAMSAEPYAVAPDADVVDVTAYMAEHKYGCAVVMEHKKVVGVFSSSDALQLLSGLLRATDGAAKQALAGLTRKDKARKK
jgi:acetoin utilization protein AcuB